MIKSCLGASGGESIDRCLGTRVLGLLDLALRARGSEKVEDFVPLAYTLGGDRLVVGIVASVATRLVRRN